MYVPLPGVYFLRCSSITDRFPFRDYSAGVTRRLYRCYGCGYLQFITRSCYRRLALLGTAVRRDLFLSVLEQVRRSYRFVVVGYVACPSMCICW